MRFFGDIVYDDRYDRTKLDLYLPDTEGFHTIVYFHGGGLESGHKDDRNYAEIAECFTERGYGFASVEYRMYPDARFPDFLLDGAAATAYVAQHIGEYEGSGKIYISGQSAGAWISLMLCFDGHYLADAGMDTSVILGYIIDSAQTTSHFKVYEMQTGEDSRLQRIDEYAPLYFVNRDTHIPRMLLMFYDRDIACRPEQNMLLYATLKNFNPGADVEYIRLPGTHCTGSTVKDPDGLYPYFKEACRWMEK